MVEQSQADGFLWSLRRKPVIGAREVVGQLLAEQPARADVRALLVGARIDTRSLHDFVEPERLSPTGIGAVFVFRFGVVVLFGAPAAVERNLLADLRGLIVDPLPIPEVETATIEIRPNADEQVDPQGHVILREPTPERLLLTATVLARSTVLAHDEIRIAEAFDRIEPLVTALRVHGRAGLPIRQVMRHIGDVLATRHRVVGRAQVSEKPDLLWDHPDLDRLYGRLEAEYELADREHVIERKLETIGDAADVLLNLVQDRRMVRLELAIIVLIALGLFLPLYEML